MCLLCLKTNALILFIIFTSFFVGFLAGSFIKLYGCRVVAIGGCLVCASGYFLSSFADSAVGLFICYSVISGEIIKKWQLEDFNFQLDGTIVFDVMWQAAMHLSGQSICGYVEHETSFVDCVIVPYLVLGNEQYLTFSLPLQEKNSSLKI